MGTRGFVGFVVDGTEHLTYNGMSSGPDWLGREILGDLKNLLGTHSPAVLRDRVGRLVDPADAGMSVRHAMAASPAFAQYVREHGDAGPTGKTLDDSDEDTWAWWSSFVDLPTMLDWGFYEANNSFPVYSGHCEWGYLIDLDRDNGPDRPPGVLEVYRGLQRTAPKAGRWKNRPTRREMAEDYQWHLDWCAEHGRESWETKTPRYKACAPVAVWALDSLPEETEMIALYEAYRNGTLRPLTDTAIHGTLALRDAS